MSALHSLAPPSFNSPFEVTVAPKALHTGAKGKAASGAGAAHAGSVGRTAAVSMDGSSVQFLKDFVSGALPSGKSNYKAVKSGEMPFCTSELSN